MRGLEKESNILGIIVISMSCYRSCLVPCCPLLGTLLVYGNSVNKDFELCFPSFNTADIMMNLPPLRTILLSAICSVGLMVAEGGLGREKVVKKGQEGKGCV